MTEQERQLHEDRQLRNAAKGLVKRSVGNLKGGFSSRGLGGRVASRVKDGGSQIADDGVAFARDHKAQIGVGLAVGALAVVGWMFRDRIADAVLNLVQRDEDTSDQDGDESVTPDEPETFD